MLDFIMIPLIIGITTLGVYGIFELLVHRKERIILFEKMSGIIDPSSMPHLPSFQKRRFGALKAAGLIMGIGFGLLIGFFIAQVVIPEYDIRYLGNWEYTRRYDMLVSAVYGASVLLMGGLGLIISFFIEIKLDKKSNCKD